MKKCATDRCQNRVEKSGEKCENCSNFNICGWYTPSWGALAGNKCVVGGCTQDAAYHLCKEHAVRGVVVRVQDKRFVVSFWLVERPGLIHLISLNDQVLGEIFGGQQEFEDRLRKQGYKVHGLISDEKTMEAAKQKYLGLWCTPWSPSLPDGEGSVDKIARID